MAGKRQHYVPRLLQRGFLADPTDEAERTWLHRLGSDARLVGIRDVGVKDWFYSRTGAASELTLDKAITDFENDLGKEVAILRGTMPGKTINPKIAARTVVHLVMRTAHLRRTISSGIEGISSEIEAIFTDPARLGSMLGLNSLTPAAAVTDAIKQSAQELIPAGLHPSLSERLLTFLVRERGDQLVTQAVAALAPLFPTLFKGLATRVRDSHNALISKPLDDHGWVAALSSFAWTIEAATDLILPDPVALAYGDGGALVPLLFTNSAEANVVVLPIAHDRMLVGRRCPPETVDLTTFNSQAAASCQNFFIGSRSFDTAALSAEIGTGPAKKLAEAIAEVVDNAEKARSPTSDQLLSAQPIDLKQKNFSYRVILHDFGDDVLAYEYGEILQSVIGKLSRDIPLYNLDGITIAADYNDALAKLDRGDNNLPPVASTTFDYSIGVAMPVTVVREDQLKKHLVFQAKIADGWTSDDDNIRAGSLNLLVNMLGGIAFSARYPDAPSFTPDPMGHNLHPAVARAPSAYFSAKQAAFIAPDQGLQYADLVLHSFDHARQAIRSARESMADDSDVGEAFKIALECVSVILGHAADWVGHHDGLSEDQPFTGDDLPTRLSAYGLDHWLGLFGRDLAASYADGGALNLAVVTKLSLHVERLFWSLGVYCWPEDGQVRCVVSDRPILPL